MNKHSKSCNDDIEEKLSLEIDALAHFDRETLVKYAKNFIYFQNKVEILQKGLSNDDRFVIDEYFDNPVDSSFSPEPRGFIGEVVYLTKIAKQLSSLLRADTKAMAQLARDDPGAYAKSLSYRRAKILPGEPLGKFSENLLSAYIAGQNKSFNRDHSHWYLMCESGQLESEQARVSVPLDQLTIGDHFVR
ncbi:hypothetical protein [Idiomarina sp.]|uniref:hypothetical protein n=1 Tax=Idiomarina sp. TaxID=1874361 RepID=UPI00260A1DD1|nr:hypothetical protein [Idiomarina sp.]